jgi:DNA primase
MSILQNTTGCVSEICAPWESRDSGNDFEAVTEYQKLISKARSVPIIEIMRRYHLPASYESKKICCPFKNHKSGRENTSSLYIYPETNTFHCFGCKAGRDTIDFVMNIEGISKIDAAYRILQNHKAGDIDFVTDPSYKDKFNITLELSNYVRDKLRVATPDIRGEIETVLSAFDKVINEHKLTTEGIEKVVAKIKSKIDEIFIKTYNNW